MRAVTIDGRIINDDTPAYVIAELGHNHGGSVATAKRLIGAAARAGADAVKFQKRDNVTLYSAALLEQPYDNEHSFGPTYGAHRAALEFDADQFAACQATAQACGVTCFATAFDEPSADFVLARHMPAIKIASGGLTDLALLDHVARLGVPIVLSTGGGTWDDVDTAVNLLRSHKASFALLHCTAAYPVMQWSELNLLTIVEMRARYPDVVIGWSGHDSGIAMALVAYAYGARIIEKHFTLNRAMKGTDHAFSLEPAGLTKLCRDLQRAHDAKGDGVKRWYESERAPIAKMRRVQTDYGLRITGEYRYK